MSYATFSFPDLISVEKDVAVRDWRYCDFILASHFYVQQRDCVAQDERGALRDLERP